MRYVEHSDWSSSERLGSNAKVAKGGIQGNRQIANGPRLIWRENKCISELHRETPS